jgi:Radical SAM superfamily
MESPFFMSLLSNLSRVFAIRRPKPKPRAVDRLELHVTHACNLACESCSHYSNHGHQGNLDLAQADRWMEAWSGRIVVGEFCLLGGEPSIHPQLSEFVVLVRKHWPTAHIRIVTNGFFLHRHPDLPTTLAADGNADLALSVHHDGADYAERLRPILDLLAIWQRDHGTIVHTWRSHLGWTRRYLGFGAAMLPFEDGQPRRSWEICPARYCKQLHDGKLWKCAPLAYLGLQKAKYDLSEKWDPYLRYRALDAPCTDRELDEFLALEDEPACSMCSAEPRRHSLPNPLRADRRMAHQGLDVADNVIE